MIDQGSSSREWPCRRASGRLVRCRRTVVVALALLSCVAAAGQHRDGGRQESTLRLLQGRITNRSGQPVARAVVFLKNTKTLAVKTFIASADGAYRFPALSPNVDYEVYAEHDGKRSNVKTLSAFDSRPEPHIDLKIDE